MYLELRGEDFIKPMCEIRKNADTQCAQQALSTLEERARSKLRVPTTASLLNLPATLSRGVGRGGAKREDSSALRRREEDAGEEFPQSAPQFAWRKALSLPRPIAPAFHSGEPWCSGDPTSQPPRIMTGTSVCLAVLLAVGSRFTLAYQGSGYSPIEDDEDVYARNRYKDIPWCSPIKVKYGYANCRSPQEGYYRNVLGTTCDIHCQKGYGLSGPQHVICQSNKRWSGKVLCKQKRCPTLSMPPNGGFKCVDGAYFNSRCEYYCSPGYQLKGDRVVQCMDNKAWSGRPASCVDMEPPRIQCPSIKEKIAEPNKLTSRVFWDTPEGQDTADGILTDVILKGLPPGSYFSEGNHKIQYTVYDRAGNKGTCKFLVKVRVRRCGKSNAPDNGYIKCSGDGDNYGATCDFSCIGGYELQGSPARVCQYNLGWSGTEPTCTPMNINIGVRTAAALLDQFYEKRRLLIISTPTASNYFYRMQLGILQPAQCGLDLRHVTVIELVGVYPAQVGRIGLRLMPPALALQLRLLLRIPHYNFYMVVVDKHGVDKERYPFPATPAELYALIDTFPLRKEEMKLQAEIGRSCP